MKGLSLLACTAVLAFTGFASAAPLPPQRPIHDNPVWFSACATGQYAPRSDMDIVLPRMATSQKEQQGNPLYTITEGYNPSCDAYGFFDDTIESVGWAYLHTESNPALSSPWQRAYSSAYLEGYLTWNRVWQSLQNSLASTFPKTNGTVPPTVYKFIADQAQYIQEQISSSPPTSAYWTQVNAVYGQVEGLYDGYSSVPGAQEIQMSDILVANLLGEVEDMEMARDPLYRAAHDVTKMDDLRKVKRTLEDASHCSALIRLAPDGTDVFSAHTTWTGFANMLRIYKYYGAFTATGNAIQFSSFPGCVSSIDDYYQTSANMVVIETTNNIANMSLYDLVTPESVPTFVRVMVANALTTSGQDWAEMYALQNSGTYNNQWMIVDHKHFTPYRPPAFDLLWIASQIPGEVVTADVTNVLWDQGYWASYNIPYFPQLWETLGYASLVQKFGSDGEYLWNYTASFRAEIFARDAPKVATLADMQAIIQENNWQTDPLSRGSAELAIASRMDLSSGPLGEPHPSGAIDAKLTSWTLMFDRPMTVLAKCGPTVEAQVPFTWSTSPWAGEMHLGQPDTFNFAWVTYEVQTPNTTTTATARSTDTPQPKIALE